MFTQYIGRARHCISASFISWNSSIGMSASLPWICPHHSFRNDDDDDETTQKQSQQKNTIKMHRVLNIKWENSDWGGFFILVHRAIHAFCDPLSIFNFHHFSYLVFTQSWFYFPTANMWFGSHHFFLPCYSISRGRRPSTKQSPRKVNSVNLSTYLILFHTLRDDGIFPFESR